MTIAAEAETEVEIVADVPEWSEGLLEPHRNKVLYGGRSGAKSWTVARVLLAKGAEAPLRVLCAREIQNSIKDSVHKLLENQAKEMGLPYHVLDTEISHPNGTVFIFKGLRTNPSSFKSFEDIDIVWVEEADRVSKESWDKLLPTIRKKGSEVWVTFNPDLEDDPTYQLFIAKPLPGTWSKKVNAEDNPWLSDESRILRAHAYAVDPDAADHIWGGNCRKATEAQILRGKWVVEEFEPDPSWDGPYHGLDFGFALNPTVACKLWIATRRNAGQALETLYVEREASKVGLELDDTAAYVLARIPGIDGYTLRADSARPESISYLKRGGPNEETPLPKIVPCRKWPGSIEDGIAHLRQYHLIVIHPRCERAIFEAKNYSYVVDARTGDVKPQVRDLHNDFWDSARYALGPLIKQRSQVDPYAGIPGTRTSGR